MYTSKPKKKHSIRINHKFILKVCKKLQDNIDYQKKLIVRFSYTIKKKMFLLRFFVVIVGMHYKKSFQ